MKTHSATVLEKLFTDRTRGPKISLYVPVRGDAPAHVLLSRLRDSALRLIPDENLAREFRLWIQSIRDEKTLNPKVRTVAYFFSGTHRERTHLFQEIPPRVVVAQSWHVKPLLFDSKTRNLGHVIEFHPEGISVVRSNGEDHVVIGTVSPAPKKLPSRFWPDEIERAELRDLISRAAAFVTEGALVMISGAPDGFAQSPRFWQHFFSDVVVDDRSLGSTPRNAVIGAFNELLSKRPLPPSPGDLVLELSGAPVISDPALIAQRIVEGKVGRIFVSLEAIQWGVLDPETGRLKKSKFQSNHQDEDLLDDIAELALSRGIEVRIFRQSAFPGNLEILAA